MQDNIIFQMTLKEIDNIQKFYLFYHSSLITFNPGLENILQNIPNELNNQKIIISHLTDAPNKLHKRIDVEVDKLKHYALNDGQNFVFKSCVIYLYSLLENVIIYKKYAKTTDECHKTINQEILNDLKINEENKMFIYKLRELRNAFVHDNSVWSAKRAKRLSKILTGNEDRNYSFILYNIEIKVCDRITYIDTKQFKWIIDTANEIIKKLFMGKEIG